MGTIMDLLDAVERFDPKSSLLDSIIENENSAVEMNRDQLLNGRDSLGEKLKEYVDDQYAELKQRMNPLPGYGTPDLKLTGDFHRGFYLDISSIDDGNFELGSTDEKTQELVDKYNESIFGLDKENSELFWFEKVVDSFAQKVLDQMGLIMQNV